MMPLKPPVFTYLSAKMALKLEKSYLYVFMGICNCCEEKVAI